MVANARIVQGDVGRKGSQRGNALLRAVGRPRFVPARCKGGRNSSANALSSSTIRTLRIIDVSAACDESSAINKVSSRPAGRNDGRW
tara:strand:- start:230 stop:490 length:261 start_codon:yes stop_codon:yes gene_type:complete